jgi:hypothetical protein
MPFYGSFSVIWGSQLEPRTEQIASICFCTEDEIKVSTADVQKQ